jgi:putative transposase
LVAKTELLTAAQVASHLGVAPKTVRAIARRYEEEGLEPALYEKPRPGQPRVLDAGQSQRIIAMVCSQPPDGRARWSVRLIAQEAVKRKVVPQVVLRKNPCAALQTTEMVGS